jgi:hypothetical protein
MSGQKGEGRRFRWTRRHQLEALSRASESEVLIPPGLKGKEAVSCRGLHTTAGEKLLPCSSPALHSIAGPTRNSHWAAPPAGPRLAGGCEFNTPSHWLPASLATYPVFHHHDDALPAPFKASRSGPPSQFTSRAPAAACCF